MKKAFILLGLIVTIHQSVLAQCNSGSVTVTTNATITGSCIINGDLTIQNGGSLNVDLTSAQLDTFVVRGNILLQGNGFLWIHAAAGSSGEQFIVSNNYSNQRSITTLDSSRIKLEYVEFKTQEGSLNNAASIYMSYFAKNSSIFYVNNSTLDTQTAWLLCNLNNRSTLVGYNPNHVPTETYLADTAQISLHGPGTNLGLWLTFDSITDTLNLPTGQTQPFSWKIGRGAGGLNTTWYLEEDTAKAGIGVQILSTAKVTINGTGVPSTGELKVALLFANSSDTLKNLKVGIQNTTVATGPSGHVTLNNVNLGPIAWQVYALMNEKLYIKNSVINEIGIAGPSAITVESSTLQFALLAATGIGGSTLTINNSSIWNQAITAANNGKVILNNCTVTGSAFSTTDPTSHITVNGGCFFSNATGCTENTMVNLTTGQPYCDPFIPPGPPQNLTPATVTFSGVNDNCATGIKDEIRGVAIFPNPAHDQIQVKLSNPDQSYFIVMYSTLGQPLLKTSNQSIIDISQVPSGFYIMVVQQADQIWTNRIVKQ